MVKVHVNTKRLSKAERKGRKTLREAIISPSSSPLGPDIYLKRGIPYEFLLKRPKIDAQGHIDAYYFEEGMRQQFYYPFIQNKIVFDIGACHGAYTMPALALGAYVYAFEPDPRWQKSLLDSVKLNPGFKQRFCIINNAVSDGNYPNTIMDELEQVQCITLDSFVDHYKIYPDFIKIDAEGMEGRIIKGALNTLKHEPYPRLLIEHHPMVAPHSYEYILETLTEMGYIIHPLRQRSDWVFWTYFDHSYFNP